MSTPTYNLTLTTGSSLAEALTLRQADGSPFDATGAELVAAIAAATGDEPLAQLTITWLDRTQGQALLELSAAAIAALPLGVFGWDLRLIDSLGRPLDPILTGSVTRKHGYTP